MTYVLSTVTVERGAQKMHCSGMCSCCTLVQARLSSHTSFCRCWLREASKGQPCGDIKWCLTASCPVAQILCWVRTLSTHAWMHVVTLSMCIHCWAGTVANGTLHTCTRAASEVLQIGSRNREVERAVFCLRLVIGYMS
jgi:hypothetical protein